MGIIEAQNLIRQRTNHVCRLCCSRAPQAVLQGAPLDCSNETHCSAAWTMAPAGSYLHSRSNSRSTQAGPRFSHPTKQTKENPETRHKRIRGHPPPDRGRRYQERIQETLEAPYPQASVTIIVNLLSLAWVLISANALVTTYSTHNESWAPDFNCLSEGGRDCTGGRSIQRRADTKQRNQRRRERREGRPGQEKRMSHTQQE